MQKKGPQTFFEVHLKTVTHTQILWIMHSQLSVCHTVLLTITVDFPRTQGLQILLLIKQETILLLRYDDSAFWSWFFVFLVSSNFLWTLFRGILSILRHGPSCRRTRQNHLLPSYDTSASYVLRYSCMHRLWFLRPILGWRPILKSIILNVSPMRWSHQPLQLQQTIEENATPQLSFY